MNFEITLPTLPAVEQWLGEYPRRLDDALSSAVQEAGYRVQGWVKDNTPVRTGRLKESVVSTLDSVAGTIRDIVSSDVIYAPFVEEGTRYMTGRGMFKQAYERAQGEIAEIVEHALEGVG